MSMVKENEIEKIKKEWRSYVESYGGLSKKAHLLSGSHVVFELIEKAFALGQKETETNKLDAIFEMLNLLDEKVTAVNNRFSSLAKELGYKV